MSFLMQHLHSNPKANDSGDILLDLTAVSDHLLAVGGMHISGGVFIHEQRMFPYMYISHGIGS